MISHIFHQRLRISAVFSILQSCNDSSKLTCMQHLFIIIIFFNQKDLESLAGIYLSRGASNFADVQQRKGWFSFKLAENNWALVALKKTLMVSASIDMCWIVNCGSLNTRIKWQLRGVEVNLWGCNDTVFMDMPLFSCFSHLFHCVFCAQRHEELLTFQFILFLVGFFQQPWRDPRFLWTACKT